MPLVKNIKLYAHLLQSVGQQKRDNQQPRPLTPVQCAQMIYRLIKEEGDTLAKVSERLGLGRSQDESNPYKKRDTTQVTDFLNLLRVSEKSRNLAGWKHEKYPKLPFSVISHLAVLDENDQDTIIQSAYNSDNKKVLGKEDVKRIKSWRRANKDAPIQEGIRKVLDLKPVSTTTHMVVCETRESLKKFITNTPSYREIILGILREHLNGLFYSIDATDVLITISMDEMAYHTFHEQQYKKNISFTDFLNRVLEDKVG